jgi:glycosyltransferase involved in cell wall biosynthesis
MTAHVLHVLPHAGAGAQTYIDTLSSLEGFSFETFELSNSRSAPRAAASILAHQPPLAAAARRADLVHVHGEVASLLALPWLAARRSVVTLHGLHLLRRLSAGLPQRMGRANLRVIVAASNVTICVSLAERDELRWLPARHQSKLAVVLNGLELPPPRNEQVRQRLRSELELDPDTVAVLYAGQLESRKDPLTAVHAVELARSEDPRLVMLIAGDGPMIEHLRASAGDGARFLGQRDDVEDLMSACDVFVMPSLREGLSYAVLEALGHGLPTIASDAPGNQEAVGDAGLVFPAGDERRLSELILSLSADPRRRAALGAAGRERIASELSAERMRAATLAVYRRALTGPGPGVGERAA